MTSAIAIIGSAGCALGAAYIGKTIARTFRDMQRLSKLTKGSPFTYYYRGGFESKMSRKEASLILNARDHFSKTSIRDAHKRIMLLNHPDRGGSPFIAAKINEAKALLEKDLSD